MIASINTGFWTAIFATVNIILLVRRSDTLLYGITGLPLCSLYSNTVLGNLCVRTLVKEQKQHRTEDAAISLGTIPGGLPTVGSGKLTSSLTSPKLKATDFSIQTMNVLADGDQQSLSEVKTYKSHELRTM